MNFVFVILFAVLTFNLSHALVPPVGFYNTPNKLEGVIQSKEDQKTLFKYVRTVSVQNQSEVIKRSYFDTQGVLAAEETVTYQSGKVIKMELNQIQTGDKGYWLIEGNKIKFSYTQAGEEKTKTDEEDLEDNLISQDEIVHFLYNNWQKLEKGESLNIRLPVIFRTETVGFKFFKEKIQDGEFIVRMKPSSPIIAAIVKPLFFHFKVDGDHRLLKVDGRTTPKIKEGSKWKDLDAFLVISY